MNLVINTNYEEEHLYSTDIENIIFYIEEFIKSEKSLMYNKIELNYNFVSIDTQVQLNKEYINHDYNTDIITFNLSEGEDDLLGDIYINLNIVVENAKEFNESIIDEIKRVMIHGFFHLIGYNDKEENDIELMRLKEDAFINFTNTFHVEHKY